MHFFSKCKRIQGSGKLTDKELLHKEVKFKIFKFNSREKPRDKRRILIISCFCEFGCEALSLMYCIPKIIAKNPGAYVICAGWYGREYLYRHLVDEFWEIDESCMHLREYSNAFISKSKNLAAIEKKLKDHGAVYECASIGHICVGNVCTTCKKTFGSDDANARCPLCNSPLIERSLLADIPYHKKFAVAIPRPSIKKQEEAKKYLGPNPVGVFARGRQMYGRNLPPEFYVALIDFLKKRNFTPIWLGEKQSVLPCPVDDVVDFSRLPESRDLELTLAIVSNLQFTVQFWTASTRLASMMGTPWILFESPDQLFGHGQEGKRILLTTEYNKKKLIISHYFNILENQMKALEYLDQAIEEMHVDNWSEIVGLVENPEMINNSLSILKKWRGA